MEAHVSGCATCSTSGLGWVSSTARSPRAAIALIIEAHPGVMRMRRDGWYERAGGKEGAWQDVLLKLIAQRAAGRGVL